MECTRSNAEYDKDVEITAGGRKHRNSARKKKNQSRYFIGRNDPPIMTCPHTVLVFRQHLFAQASKVEQDRFLLKFMHTSIPTYRRRTEPNNLNPKSVVTKYTVRKENGEEQSCSLAKFKKIFYNDLNLGFGNPHTDTCSTCKKFEVRIKQTQDSNKKGDLRTQLKLHKLRAKKFYQLMNKESPNTVKIIFDMQQNQPLPKLSVGEVFFTRQVWLYNLTDDS
nr:unnamed protein product [Callosobruchus chinensis]